VGKPGAAKWLERVRVVCLALPETSERQSHGAPTFFVGKKSFASFLDDHHGDGKLALWCAASLEAQQLMVSAQPRHFFVPAYVGYLGWVGVRLDTRLPLKTVKQVLEQAWRVCAKPRALALLPAPKRG
jgi:hypothetical protein